jgi:hypothetical protein
MQSLSTWLRIVHKTRSRGWQLLKIMFRTKLEATFRKYNLWTSKPPLFYIQIEIWNMYRLNEWINKRLPFHKVHTIGNRTVRILSNKTLQLKTLSSSITNAETYKRQINFLVSLQFITVQTSYLSNKYWTEVVIEPKHKPQFALNFCSYLPFTTATLYFLTISQKQIFQKLYRTAQAVFTNITFSRYRGI